MKRLPLALLFIVVFQGLQAQDSNKKVKKQKGPFVLSDVSTYGGRTYVFNVYTDGEPKSLPGMLPANTQLPQFNFNEMTALAPVNFPPTGNHYTVGINIGFMRRIKGDSIDYYRKLSGGISYSRGNRCKSLSVNKQPFRIDTLVDPATQASVGLDSVAETAVLINETHDCLLFSIEYDFLPNVYKTVIGLGLGADFGFTFNNRYRASVKSGYKLYASGVNMFYATYLLSNPDEADDFTFNAVHIKEDIKPAFTETGRMKQAFVNRLYMTFSFNPQLYKGIGLKLACKAGIQTVYWKNNFQSAFFTEPTAGITYTFKSAITKLEL